MTKIQYASDLHLEFSDNWNYLKRHPIVSVGDILVLAGDTCYLGDERFVAHPFWDWAADHFERVIVCPGNHEFYNYFDLTSLNDGEILTIRPNIQYYYNDVIHNGDTDIIVSPLWSHIKKEDAYATEHGVSDFFRIIYGDHLLTSIDFNYEHERCLGFIKNAVSQSKARTKIVVTHHVPSFQLMSKEFAGSRINGAFTVELANYICNSGIDYWIYGHSHRNIESTIGKTFCTCNQLGYVGHGENVNFQPDKLISTTD